MSGRVRGSKLRILCEFNERLPDGGHVALWHDGRPLDDCAADLALANGEEIVLVDVEGGFEVFATLREQPDDRWIRWVADADWKTIIRFR